MEMNPVSIWIGQHLSSPTWVWLVIAIIISMMTERAWPVVLYFVWLFLYVMSQD